MQDAAGSHRLIKLDPPPPISMNQWDDSRQLWMEEVEEIAERESQEVGTQLRRFLIAVIYKAPAPLPSPSVLEDSLLRPLRNSKNGTYAAVISF